MRRILRSLFVCLMLATLVFTPSLRSVGANSSVGAGASIFDQSHSLFQFVRIDFPGASATNPGAINARGDVVGNYHDSSDNVHAFLLHNGAFSSFDFPGATQTLARAINARGDIAGRMFDASGIEHGFLLRDGEFTQIDFPGASATSARGINNTGDITGRHFDAAGNESGFILKNGVYYDVFFPGSCSTDVWMAEDNEGILVGDICTDADGGIHGYIRNKAGVFKRIDDPRAQAPCTAVRWINERGQMVGVYANSLDDCFNFVAHGFLLINGIFLDVYVPGSLSTGVFGINDDGVMVGQYTDAKGAAHGFIADTHLNR